MIISVRVLPLLSLLLLSGCDKRCNLSDCRTLFKDCGGVLKAEPNYARCGLSRGDEDTFSDYEDDRNYRCAQACVASNTGEALECIGEKSSSCRSGTGANVLNSCGGPVDNSACRKKCDDTRVTCETECPGAIGASTPATPNPGNKRECLDCVSRCGLAWGRCDVACKEAS